jgi:arginine decarboxylase
MAQLPPQSEAPYLDALLAYARRDPARFNVPGHKGGLGSDPGLIEAIGRQALAFDIPALMHGIDIGADSPFQQAQALAAEAWGAARTWFLVNGASQGNQVAALALAHVGDRVVVQRNAHSSTIDGLVLSGLTPTFVAPELDPDLQVAHCVTPEALDAALAATPGAAGALIVSPTYFGAVADVRGLAEVAHARGAVLVADEAWGAHFAFHPDLPPTALSLGADIVISSTHKILGSLTQSAMLHLGVAAEGRIDERLLDRCLTLIESTSPSSLLSASLDATRRYAAVHGRDLIDETIRGAARLREEVRAVEGCDVLDERMVGTGGVVAFDPLRLAIDVRGTGATGYQIADLMREQDEVHVELAGENVVVALLGMGEPVLETGQRLIAALSHAVDAVSAMPPREHEAFAPPPPWGELALSPREAFLGAQEVVPVDAAVGRVASEALAAYPPGIPNVLPGERLSAETLDYIRQTLAQGGHLRGASDRELRTLRVAVER